MNDARQNLQSWSNYYAERAFWRCVRASSVSAGLADTGGYGAHEDGPRGLYPIPPQHGILGRIRFFLRNPTDNDSHPRGLSID
jgi:hypothetical protein